MNRGYRVAVMLALLAGFPMAASRAAVEQGSTERPFAAGGRVRMDLSAGDYTIRDGAGDRIRVLWETRTAQEMASVKVDIQPGGSEARIVTSGPHNNFKVIIELPARTDLQLSLSAGDLRIEGITGSKDVGSWAGEIDIEVGRADDYASVHASVTAGDLSAEPFQVSKGGLFRSFSWKGPGRYTLNVRLTAGDLTLR